MADVVYRQRLPRSRGSLLIEVVSDPAHESIESGPNGTRLRVNKSDYQSTLAEMLKKAEGTSMQHVYVRGVSADDA